MGTVFNPTNLNSGFNTNDSLNADLTAIQTALGRMLNVYGDATYGSNAMTVDLDMNGQKVINIGAPTNPTDLITLQYGDATYGGAAATAAAASAAAAAVSETNAASSASAASTAQTNAETAETNAETAETNAETAETNSAASAVLASEWATKTTAKVATIDFSSKEYAQGSQAATGGSSKNWSQEAAGVTGAGANDRSSKSWAQEALLGATLGGSAKDWSQTAEDTLVDGTDYSAFHWAQKAALASGGDTVKVSAADTTANYLTSKIATGGTLKKALLTPGGDEDLEISNNIELKFKTADEIRSSSGTLTDDSDLAGYALEADTMYKITGVIYFNGASAANYRTGFILDNTAQYGKVRWSVTNSGAATGHEDVSSTIDNPATGIPVTAGRTYAMTIDAVVHCHASLASVLDWQWAQDTSDAGSTNTNKGSWLQVEKLGVA